MSVFHYSELSHEERRTYSQLRFGGDFDGRPNPDDLESYDPPEHACEFDELYDLCEWETLDGDTERVCFGQWESHELDQPLEDGQVYKSVGRGYYYVENDMLDDAPPDQIAYVAFQCELDASRAKYSTAKPLADHILQQMGQDSESLRHSVEHHRLQSVGLMRPTMDPDLSDQEEHLAFITACQDLEAEPALDRFDDRYRRDIHFHWLKWISPLKSHFVNWTHRYGIEPGDRTHAIEWLLSEAAVQLLRQLYNGNDLEWFDEDQMFNIAYYTTLKYFSHEKVSQCRKRRERQIITDPYTGEQREEYVNIDEPCELTDIQCPVSEECLNLDTALDQDDVIDIILDHLFPANEDVEDLADYLAVVYNHPDSTQKQIAADLGVSPRQIRRYNTRIEKQACKQSPLFQEIDAEVQRLLNDPSWVEATEASISLYTS